ncbi:hypothetical protein HPB50_021297 [Hyalomma asiaticum]|uniref:Uncharacterized protein n=1 Tax=Hyalomma asiaticum TaxID=266040 RepID=A0ACB7SS36_HYAAI|nr:hypothetical protein HPB50_021297 [Hyalomma asiaticum]
MSRATVRPKKDRLHRLWLNETLNANHEKASVHGRGSFDESKKANTGGESERELVTEHEEDVPSKRAVSSSSASSNTRGAEGS